MNDALIVNPVLVKALLESSIDSEDIAKNTGMNLQQIRSYRGDGGNPPLVELGEMRLKLAAELTREAIKQNLPANEVDFLEKEDICGLLKHPKINANLFEKETGIKSVVFNACKEYADDDEKIGLIRLKLIMELLALVNSK